MKATTFAVLLAGIAWGCSGGADGSLLPGQVSADEPTAVPPPTNPGGPTAVKSPPPPADDGPSPGCPSLRSGTASEVTDAAALRAELVGVYRTCMPGLANLELRADPDSETRLRWWSLDERFVRTSDSGSFDVLECVDTTCNLDWYRSGDSQATTRTVSVWNEPTALSMRDGSYMANEWVRVAD